MTTVKIRRFTLNRAQGFTVIELMLFLGITGALFAALMIGTSSTITQQRYRESVQDYSGFLQNQYSEVLNTRNERADDWQCENGTVARQPNGGEARGTSSCVLLGRAVQVNVVDSVIGGKATEITSSPVIGTEPIDLVTPSDIEALVAYQPQLSREFDTSDMKLDWGSNLMTTEDQPSMASFLILRSPVSGLIRVFVSESQLPGDLSALILTPDASTKAVVNCVVGDSGLLPTQSVTVFPKVAGPEGVVVKENDPECA